MKLGIALAGGACIAFALAGCASTSNSVTSNPNSSVPEVSSAETANARHLCDQLRAHKSPEQIYAELATKGSPEAFDDELHTAAQKFCRTQLRHNTELREWMKNHNHHPGEANDEPLRKVGGFPDAQDDQPHEETSASAR